MTFWDRKRTLWRRGRLSLVFEPRDLWSGWFHGEDADYVVIIPCLPVRIERG
jgi:hypothetical protein